MDNYGIIANPFYFNSAKSPPKKCNHLSIEPIVSLTWDSFPSNSSEMKRFDRWNLVSKAVFEGKHMLANMGTVVILAKTAW